MGDWFWKIDTYPEPLDIHCSNGQPVPLEKTPMFTEPVGWTYDDEMEYQRYLHTGVLVP